MRARLSIWLAVLTAILLLAAAPSAAATTGAPRLALVIGNAAYPARPLATATADAGLVAQALAQAGYDVTAAMDLDGKRLRAALHGFADKARAGPEATIFVYVSGEGVQYEGDNYVVPVDAALAHDDDVPLQAVDLDDFARALAAAPAKARFLVYDLSRENPFAAGDEMPLAPGLALTVPPKDTLVAFSAAPGMIAPTDPVPYGPYARALAEALGTSGLPASAALERVRLRVGTLTNGAQVPWEDGTLSPDVALAAGAAPTGPASALEKLPPGAQSTEVAYSAVIARDSLDGYTDFLRVVPDGPLAARVRVLLAMRREATMWRAVAASDDPRAAWTYMRRYPRGPHRFDARRRLAALKAQLEPPPRFDIAAFPGLPAPSEAEPALVAHPREAQRGLPPIPAPPEALLPPADPAFYDDLPPPTPGLRGVLPVAMALPLSTAPAQAGHIVQTTADGAEITTETRLAPGGSAELTLSDEAGVLLTLRARTERNGTRTILETGPKGAAKSRTTTTRVGDILTTVQDDGAGTTLMKTVVRADPDGGSTTRVTDGADAVLAAWRRDAAGIVVARQPGGDATPTTPAPAPLPVAPTSPTIAVPAPPVRAPLAPVPKPVLPKPVLPKPVLPKPVLPKPLLPKPPAAAPSPPKAAKEEPALSAPTAPPKPLPVVPRPVPAPIVPPTPARPAPPPALIAPSAARAPSTTPLPPPRPSGPTSRAPANRAVKRQVPARPPAKAVLKSKAKAPTRSRAPPAKPAPRRKGKPSR